MEQKLLDTWVWVPFEVDKKFNGWRIDQFLTQRLTGYSRSKVQKILSQARVHKEGKPAKTNARVKTSDKIEVAYLRKPETPLAPDAALEVLFEDDHLILVNKPANLLSHPTDKVVHHTVLGVLRQSRPDLETVHLLHRLDRETSGVMALGKTVAAARGWTQAMARHEIKKEYLALVWGFLDPPQGLIDRPIGRQGGEIHVRQRVDGEGAVKAVTRYETIAHSSFVNPQSRISLVRTFPQTGRLHQIRVHLASIGAPLLGDPLYTGDGALYRQMVEGHLSDAERQEHLGFSRVALHASRLSFTHPLTGQELSIQAPLAADMDLYIKSLNLTPHDAIIDARGCRL